MSKLYLAYLLVYKCTPLKVRGYSCLSIFPIQSCISICQTITACGSLGLKRPFHPQKKDHTPVSMSPLIIWYCLAYWLAFKKNIYIICVSINLAIKCKSNFRTKLISVWIFHETHAQFRKASCYIFIKSPY